MLNKHTGNTSLARWWYNDCYMTKFKSLFCPRLLIALAVIFTATVSNAVWSAGQEPSPVQILLPLNGSLFPADCAAPLVSWKDTSAALSWRIGIFSSSFILPPSESGVLSWRPAAGQWNTVKEKSMGQAATITVEGYNNGKIVSRGEVAVSVSKDPVSAPIFFREVVLPVTKSLQEPVSIRWRLGNVSSSDAPRIILENVRICANCHAFTPDGKTLGMDVDIAGDKGTYIITDIDKETVLSKDKVITWNDFKRGTGGISYGLFSQFSPDGRYVVSTVKDYPVFFPFPELGYSQLFFPVRGSLVVYDRQTKRFFPLPGGDDPEFVQTNPVFSPDGKWLVFARAKAIMENVDLSRFVVGKELFRYDLYRIPFNEGRGGKPEPLEGASNNNRSNYFPKFTPDGKWLVYTQSNSYMIIQPDAELHLVPAGGGKDRRLELGLNGKMASWHSLSPNGEWMVYSAKANGPYAQLWLTHLDEDGRESVPVLLDWFTPADRSANIPEFVNVPPDFLTGIKNNL